MPQPWRRHVRPGEERQVRAGVSLGVRVEQVVRARVVLVDALLDEPDAEHAGIEVEVLLRGAGDGGDVMQTARAVHGVPPRPWAGAGRAGLRPARPVYRQSGPEARGFRRSPAAGPARRSRRRAPAGRGGCAARRLRPRAATARTAWTCPESRRTAPGTGRSGRPSAGRCATPARSAGPQRPTIRTRG